MGKVIDIASRLKRKPKRVRCLTILLDEPAPKAERPTSLRQATPEEVERRKHWLVGVFHRPGDAKPPVTPGHRPLWVR